MDYFWNSVGRDMNYFWKSVVEWDEDFFWDSVGRVECFGLLLEQCGVWGGIWITFGKVWLSGKRISFGTVWLG